MQIPVLLFASYADAFGATSIELSLEPDATVADLLAKVKMMAAGAVLPPAPLVAVNQTFAAAGQRIRAGDEVALIPPVAGG